jgi:hypothetical protein
MGSKKDGKLFVFSKKNIFVLSLVFIYFFLTYYFNIVNWGVK